MVKQIVYIAQVQATLLSKTLKGCPRNKFESIQRFPGGGGGCMGGGINVTFGHGQNGSRSLRFGKMLFVGGPASRL